MAAFGFALDLARRRRGVASPSAALGAFAGDLYAAFGLQRLLTAYTGPCVRVRRAVDGAEADIGFTPSGLPDVAALLAFAGAGSAYITMWHDQTGGGRHATQATGAAQPRLVNAGVLDVGSNGRPVAVFSGAQYLDVQNSVGFSRAGAASTYAAISRATAAGTQLVLSSPATSAAAQARALIGYLSDSTTPLIQARSTDTSTIASQAGATVSSGAWTRLIGRARYAAGAVDIGVNGAVSTNGTLAPAQNTPNANAAANVRIGAFTGGTLFLTGGISTVVLAESALDIAALDAALEEVMP